MFLNRLSRGEQIEWLLGAQSDLNTIQQAIPNIKAKCIDGVESLEHVTILNQVKEQAAANYDYDMEPTVAGLEGFASAISTGITKIRDMLKGDRSGSRKILQGNSSELKEALGEYTGSGFSYKVKESDKKITIAIPAGATTPEKLISDISKAMSETMAHFTKYQQDVAKFGKALAAVYKKAEKVDFDETVSLKDIPNLIDFAPFDKLDKQLESLMAKKDQQVDLMTESQVKLTVDFFKHVNAYMESMSKGIDGIFHWYRLWEMFEDDIDDKILEEGGNTTSGLDERIDDISFVGLTSDTLVLKACQALEEWMLKSIK